jgi:hypothetical protein
MNLRRLGRFTVVIIAAFYVIPPHSVPVTSRPLGIQILAQNGISRLCSNHRASNSRSTAIPSHDTIFPTNHKQIFKTKQNKFFEKHPLLLLSLSLHCCRSTLERS